MRLIGLMLVRNEEWCIASVVRSALKWCDGLAVLLHKCTDKTADIVRKETNKAPYIRVKEAESDTVWMEMDHRQRTLEMGRDMGGTHFAVVDGDEMLTDNLHEQVREWFYKLESRQLIELPRIAPVSHDQYWADNHEHASGAITLGFRDDPVLAWRPRGSEAYHFHGRPPHGSGDFTAPLGRDRTSGGIMHLQYMNRMRMRAKSLWYMLNERVRWPDRKTPAELNSIYSAMLDAPSVVADIPDEWWAKAVRRDVVQEEAPSWHLFEARDMVERYGRDILHGINQQGFEL